MLNHFHDTGYEDQPVDPILLAGLANNAEKKGYEIVWGASEAEVHELATRYGQITCLSLCKEMQQKLSRELRDMIYEQLLPQAKKVEAYIQEEDCYTCRDEGDVDTGSS
jgi:hypothetical protein